jgi:hypothetical protein
MLCVSNQKERKNSNAEFRGKECKINKRFISIKEKEVIFRTKNSNFRVKNRKLIQKIY